jgi:anti-sigma regulatory factor (Ser/Thr protein kinase)
MEDARLMVSELVTNAVLHGGDRAGSAIAVDVRLLPASVVVSVADPGRGFDPARLEPSRAGAPGRRGLELVAALAEKVGVDGARPPFRVWFEIARTDVPAT